MQWTGDVTWPDGTTRMLISSDGLARVIEQVNALLPAENRVLGTGCQNSTVKTWTYEFDSGWKVVLGRTME